MTVRVGRIDEHPSPHGGRLGRHVEHDDRSRAFAVELGPIHTVSHRRYGAIFDQGELGSCTGNAIAGTINTSPVHRPGVVLAETDAVNLYAAATRLDDISGSYPPDDTGSSGLAACKAAKAAGYISGYKHAFSIEQALASLTATSVITGVAWYEGFDQPDDSGFVTIAGQVRGGHEIEVHAILAYTAGDLAKTVVEAENSWGIGWGYRGRFRMTAQTWAELLDQDGDVTVPMR